MAWLKDRAPGLHRFLTRGDRPYPLVREVVGGALVILVLLALLYGATAQPLAGGRPVVVVTSGSMMHCRNAGTLEANYGRTCESGNYGRIGTIDPGDLVFVRSVDSVRDVATLAGDGDATYGKAGDVIVYHPRGSLTATAIIHRALFFVQAESDGTYSVADLGISHASSLDQARLVAVTGCILPLTKDSGFVTRGDNNLAADQCPGNASGPVRLEWVIGKARGEVPWVGLVKLFVDDLRSPPGATKNFANASMDAKVLLVVTLGVLLAAPSLVGLARRLRAPRGP
ncbi:MAG TPA: hypothetical protein VM286_03210 [Candidatus Thermoplasmatota archaeon]|nr:hypothetical protein [Candidatus Thermoplasmatota archaeon]